MSIFSPALVAALHCLPSMTPRSLQAILQTELLQSDQAGLKPNDLLAAGIEPDRALKIVSDLPQLDQEKAKTMLEKFGILVVTMADPAYPSLLKEIPSPPPVLYVRGNLQVLTATFLAVVGTRLPTPYGLQAVELLIRPVARQGLGIISGLALGIDGAAHRVALAEHVPTVGVLGCGADLMYPWQHQRLAEDIIASGGAIISEFPLGAKPERYHFPQRNRIISGLSRAVLLVEAGEKSGALITAKYAVDQNREVLAVPGPITSAQSVGPIHWIQLGAKAVHTAHDILEVFSLASPATAPTVTRDLPTDPTQSSIVQQLGADPRHVDVIAASCRLEASVVSAALVLLELDGRVAHHGGMYYSLTS